MANFDAAFYKLYVVDPSEQNIMVFDPPTTGPATRSGRRTACPPTARSTGSPTCMIDGDIYVAENGRSGA